MVAKPAGEVGSFSPSSGLIGEHRLYVRGYRYLEVKQDPIEEIKDCAQISRSLPGSSGKRPPMRVSCGCHVKGSAPLVPDLTDSRTTKAGVRKRFLRKPPSAEEQLVGEFRRFVRRKVRELFVPLASDVDVSVEHWLSHTNYPDWRRKELQVQWDGVGSMWDPDKSHRYFRCSSFAKDEDYPTYKHSRAINSRSDQFKCAVGPIFKLIEEQVYKHEAFIKHVPVADRPDYIMSLLHREGAKYFATDYSSFEALFTKELMEACEFELYAYMTQHLPTGGDFMRLVREVLGGLNLCVFKDFRVMVEATRMSGEMCTSLGNGFSNLMLMHFICRKCGCRKVRGVVEGDDGLFTMVGTPPTKEDFARMGLIIKAEVHDTISTASFCGLIFDPEDRINVTDPRKVLNNFSWIQRTYATVRSFKLRGLLRCKALSLAYQYPGCPIIAALGHFGIRVTESIGKRNFVEQINRQGWLTMYERDRLLSAMHKGHIPFKKPRWNTRLLVERMYGISVQAQEELEAYLGSLSAIQVLDHEVLDEIIPPLWRSHAQEYSFVAGRLDRDLVFPVQVWAPLPGLKVEWNEEDAPISLSNRRLWSSVEKLYGPTATIASGV